MTAVVTCGGEEDVGVLCLLAWLEMGRLLAVADRPQSDARDRLLGIRLTGCIPR